jgi:hypothetical protein
MGEAALWVTGSRGNHCAKWCHFVFLAAHMTKRSVRSHWVYKPSPNEIFFPGLCPISLFNGILIVIISSIYVSFLFLVTVI